MLSNLTAAALWLSGSSELSLLAKATLLLAAALVTVKIARRSRASVRHLVIATSFAALIALPILVASIPAIGIEMPAAPTAVQQAATDTAPPVSSGPAAAAAAVRSVATRVAPGLSAAQWLRLVWAAGAIVFLIPVASALWRLSVIRRTGLPVAWHRAELARLADARGVSLPVELLEHEEVPGPMTFGISKPVIVLPLDAREWSEAELRCALMHEIEHIQRGDWVMQIVARTVAAFYWFHPMVWTAWRRLCLEAERSCDDAVVVSEERTEYAEQLVTLAQRMSATPAQPMLGMANRSDLSTRVTAVLDDRLRRGRAGLTFAAGTIAAAALVVLTVAPVRAIARPSADQVTSSNEMIAKMEERRREIAELESKLQEAQSAELRAKLAERMKAMERAMLEEQRRREPSRRVRAIDRALYEASNEGNFDEVKELVAAGANPGAIVHGDGSPLMGAARSGRADIMRFLLDQGADPNGVAEGDGSPLIAAAAHGQFDQVQLLLDRGADVNLAVDGDENPLMNAAEQGNLRIVQFLVERGADIHTRLFSGRAGVSGSGERATAGYGEWRTALSQARKNGHTSVVKYLESLGARD